MDSIYIALSTNRKRFTDECLRHLPIHTPMAEATMQGANLHIGSGWGFSVLLKNSLTLGVEQTIQTLPWTTDPKKRNIKMQRIAEESQFSFSFKYFLITFLISNMI